MKFFYDLYRDDRWEDKIGFVNFEGGLYKFYNQPFKRNIEYIGYNVLISCFLCVHSPDHLERRWYQNQQQRQTGSGGGGRMIRGLGGTKHMSEVYDDDDLLRLQQDDATVAALLLDDVVLGGGYSSRNTVGVMATIG